MKMTGADLPWRITRYASVDSTNTMLKAMAADGEPEGRVLIADRQTAGRGRMTRSFFSPPGCGLYMSILFRPDLPAADALMLTPAAAVAVADAVESVLGIELGIKWVNDLFCDGRKVCGILTESAFSADGRLAYAVVGIGLNVRAPADGFPEELSSIAGALLPADAPDCRPQLATEILRRCAEFVSALPQVPFLPAYRSRSVLIDREVLLNPGGDRVKVLGIDDACRLVVQDGDGVSRALSSGECSVVL